MLAVSVELTPGAMGLALAETETPETVQLAEGAELLPQAENASSANPRLQRMCSRVMTLSKCQFQELRIEA